MDSIHVFVQNNSNPDENINLTLGLIESNKWYNFSIEYDFSTHLCSFFIDGIRKFESTFTVSSIDYFYFGDWSSNSGQTFDKIFFIDDIQVYKR